MIVLVVEPEIRGVLPFSAAPPPKPIGLLRALEAPP